MIDEKTDSWIRLRCPASCLPPLAVLAAMLICCGERETGEHPPGPSEEGTVLLVEGEEQEGGARWVLGVLASEEELERIGEEYSWEPQTFSAGAAHVWPHAAAHDGHGAFVTMESDGDQPRLVRREIASLDPLETVDLGDLEPVALHLTGRALYIGTWAEVGWVDLDGEPPVYQRLVHRPDFSYKPYDIFTRDGDRLVAIDDIMMPIFADLFELDEHGRPTHLAEWDLPGLVNGSYHHALLVPGEDEPGGALYLSGTSYSGYVGPGQELHAIPIQDDHGIGGVTIAWESPGEGEDASPTLLAGEEYTSFKGFAWLPGSGEREAALFVAAGERGILVLPHMLGTEPPSKLIDVDGPCLDVAVSGGHLHALVGGDSPRVLRLQPDGGSWAPGASLELEKPGRRFVR